MSTYGVCRAEIMHADLLRVHVFAECWLIPDILLLLCRCGGPIKSDEQMVDGVCSNNGGQLPKRQKVAEVLAVRTMQFPRRFRGTVGTDNRRIFAKLKLGL